MPTMIPYLDNCATAAINEAMDVESIEDQTYSRLCGVEDWRSGCLLRCRSRHLITLPHEFEISTNKVPACICGEDGVR
ncbi:hypothetical protein TNCV_604631 [Trichonephila clavipes]|nr:hypothetical protein TNCV_604631 [Trichonephila clavipes]